MSIEDLSVLCIDIYRQSKLENFKEKIRFCFGTRTLNKNYSVNDFGEKISGDQDDILSHLQFKERLSLKEKSDGVQKINGSASSERYSIKI